MLEALLVVAGGVIVMLASFVLGHATGYKLGADAQRAEVERLILCYLTDVEDSADVRDVLRLIRCELKLPELRRGLQ